MRTCVIAGCVLVAFSALGSSTAAESPGAIEEVIVSPADLKPSNGVIFVRVEGSGQHVSGTYANGAALTFREVGCGHPFTYCLHVQGGGQPERGDAQQVKLHCAGNEESVTVNWLGERDDVAPAPVGAPMVEVFRLQKPRWQPQAEAHVVMDNPPPVGEGPVAELFMDGASQGVYPTSRVLRSSALFVAQPSNVDRSCFQWRVFDSANNASPLSPETCVVWPTNQMGCNATESSAASWWVMGAGLLFKAARRRR